MKKTIWGLALASIFAGLSLSPEAAAHLVTVTATLDGGQENPGIVSGAHGSATFTLDRTAGTVAYSIRVYNVSAGITGAHIHVGPRGVNGPIIIDLKPPTGASNDVGWSGTATSSDLQVRASAGINSIEDALFSIASGVTYVNVHSTTNPGGELRGQICPASDKANTYTGINACAR